MATNDERHGDATSDLIADVIVVGAGSSGAVVASRLTEDAGVSVLLLEAGGRDSAKEIHIPAAFSTLFRGPNDWDYDTAPQPALGGRTVYWPRGKVLGGSSSLNAMMWVRGFAADYDAWARAAGDDWSWGALQPYVRRMEQQVSVEPQRDPRPLTGVFAHAVRQAGLAVEDPNSPQPEGFSRTAVTQRRGSRASTVTDYLTVARTRPNLTVRTGAHVTRVLFEGRRAIGVELVAGGMRRRALARREVVLSGGAVNTPQLLLLSGIGPTDEVTRHGIPLLVEAPAVGAHLRDHLVAGHILEVSSVPGGTLYSARTPSQLAAYLLRRRGMLTSNVAEAYGFVRSDPALELPDLEILFAPVAYVGEGLVPPPCDGLTVAPILLQPRSTGTITLRSADPMAKPVIDPRYLSDPDGDDRRVLLAGMAIAQRLLDTPALRAVTTGRYVLPEGGERLDAGERAERIVEEYAHTLYHPVGTARMGRGTGDDRGSVLDPALRVRGVHGLRVADASVMPQIIRGHTNAPAILIGEKAADLIRTDLRAGR